MSILFTSIYSYLVFKSKKNTTQQKTKKYILLFSAENLLYNMSKEGNSAAAEVLARIQKDIAGDWEFSIIPLSNDIFYIVVRVDADCRQGYIGRNAQNKLEFYGVYSELYNWAKQEGFSPDQINNMELYLKLKDETSLANFLMGRGNFVVVGRDVPIKV